MVRSRCGLGNVIDSVLFVHSVVGMECSAMLCKSNSSRMKSRTSFPFFLHAALFHCSKNGQRHGVEERDLARGTVTRGKEDGFARVLWVSVHGLRPHLLHAESKIDERGYCAPCLDVWGEC